MSAKNKVREVTGCVLKRGSDCRINLSDPQNLSNSLLDCLPSGLGRHDRFPLATGTSRAGKPLLLSLN